MDAVKAEQAGESTSRDERPARGSARPRPRALVSRRRSAPGSSASRAPRSIKIEQPGSGDFMREIGPFWRPTTASYSLFWAVEGRGRKSVTLDLAHAEGQDLFRRLAATADVVVENFRPGTLEHWHIGPGGSRPEARRPCASRRSARTARTRRGPASTAWASGTAGCCTSPAIPTGRRCASASRSRTTSPGCSPPRPRRPRCTRATHVAGGRAR